jgi:hypothetical protein
MVCPFTEDKSFGRPSMDDIKQQAAGVARPVGEVVSAKVEDLADRSRQKGAESIRGAARTADAIADQVTNQSPLIADYVRGAAKKIDRLADDLREKKVGDLLSSAAELGRTHPVMMLAGAAVVGFALSRLVKAGVANPDRNAIPDNSNEDPAAGLEPMRDLS